MVSSIQLTEELKDKLALRKMSSKDSYEDIIWDLLEDTLELSDQTKEEISQARNEYKNGQYVSHNQLKKELGL